MDEAKATIIRKMAVIHFSPLEKYPPVMNLIKRIEGSNKIENCQVFTSESINGFFQSPKVNIHRIGLKNLDKYFLKYIHYLIFNISVLVHLLIFRPNLIMVYETISILPVYFYQIFNKKNKIHIHYHEYVSINEIIKSSKYFKFLHFLEKKLWNSPRVKISHTNEDRKTLFLTDYLWLSEDKVKVIPNLPPKFWAKKIETAFKVNLINDNPVRLVHVGALGLKSMAVEDLVEWVVKQNGRFRVDFYISNSNFETLEYLEKIYSQNKDSIGIFPAVPYYQLPQILKNYDIGLVLYKGILPNHSFSIPNKVYEYLICGLHVWSTNSIPTTYNWARERNIINKDVKSLPDFMFAIMNPEFDLEDFKDEHYDIGNILTF